MGHIYEISGKNALVTGAAKRLGKATARALAASGCNLILHYNNSEQEAQALAASLRDEFGIKTWTVQADLNVTEETNKVVQKALVEAGTIEILINNASIFPYSNLEDITEADLMENVRINAWAPFVLSRDFYKAGGEGVIINFLDTRVLEYDRLHAAYHMSKRMFYTMTRMSALEFAPKVRVNAVAPGLILPPPGKDESFLDQYAGNNPLQRHGSKESVTEAVLFLIKSDFITGQVIYVDGGYHMKGRTYE